MKQNARKKMYIVLIILFVIIGVLSIGYAVLSQSLSISFKKVTQDAQTWGVSFSPVGTVTGEPSSSATSNTGLQCGNATVTSNSITIADTKLSKPGDQCVWPVKIVNTGTIDALLSNDDLFEAPATKQKSDSTGQTISCAPPSGTSETVTERDCDGIRYTVAKTTTGSTRLKKGVTTISAGTEVNVYLIATYLGDTLQTTQKSQYEAKYKLVFTQQ